MFFLFNSPASGGGGGPQTATPTLSGPLYGDTSGPATITITNYSATATYNVSVSAGSFIRTAGSILWTLPNTAQSATISVTAQESGQTVSSAGTWIVAVFASPADIPSDMALWASPLTAANSTREGAQLFDGGINNRYFVQDENTDLTGDVDWTHCFWANLGSASTTRSLLGKWDTSGNKRVFVVTYNSGSARFRLAVSRDGTSTAVDTLDATSHTVATNTWAFIRVWHDSAANQIGIQINNGTKHTMSITGGLAPAALASRFAIGISFTGATLIQQWSGSIGPGFSYTRVITDTEATSLYNSGAGKYFEDLTSGEKAGLYGAWSMGEPEGQALDVSGNNRHLNYSPVQPDITTGPVSGTPVNLSMIKSVAAVSPATRTLSSTTGESRPVYMTAAGTGNLFNSKPTFRFNGFGRFFSLSSAMALSGDFYLTGFYAMRCTESTLWSHSSGTGCITVMSPTTTRIVNDAGTVATITHAAIDTNGHVISFSRSASTITMRVDGVSVGTAALGGTITLNQISAHRGHSRRPLFGYLGDTLAYTAALAAAEIGYIDNWLKQQYQPTANPFSPASAFNTAFFEVGVSSESLTGSTVNSITSSVGSMVLAGSGSARPIKQTTGALAPCYEFDGADDVLTAASGFPTGSYTIFMVAQLADGTYTSEENLLGGATSGHKIGIRYDATAVGFDWRPTAVNSGAYSSNQVSRVYLHPTQPSLIAVVYEQWLKRFSIYVNGLLAQQYTVSTDNTDATVQLFAHAGSNFLAGRFKALGIHNAPMQAWQIDEINSYYAHQLNYRPHGLIMSGDSLSAGSPSNNTARFLWHMEVIDERPAGYQQVNYSTAIAGNTTPQQQTIIGLITALRMPGWYSSHNYTFMGGRNDMATGSTPAQAYTNIQNIFTAAYGGGRIGWQVWDKGITHTAAAREDTPGFTASSCAPFNSLIRQGMNLADATLGDSSNTGTLLSTGASHLTETQRNSIFWPGTAAANTTYYLSDQIHFNNEGHRQKALQFIADITL